MKLRAAISAGLLLLLGATPAHALLDTISALPAGVNKDIQFNKRGSFGADFDFYYDTTTQTMHVPNITCPGCSFSGGGGGSATSSFASIYLSSGSVTQVVSTTPAKAMIFSSNGSARGATSNASAGTVTVSTSGAFVLFANEISYQSGSGNFPIYFGIRVNGSDAGISCQDYPNPQCVMSGVVNLSSGDVVSLYVSATSTISVSFSDAQLYVFNGAGASGSSSGGGSSTSILAVTTGTANGFSTVISSPTYVINFDSTTTNGRLRGGGTYFFSLNPSSVTLQGSLVAGTNVTLTPSPGRTIISAASGIVSLDTLSPGATNFVWAVGTPQAGAVPNVSSGTISNLQTSTITFRDGSQQTTASIRASLGVATGSLSGYSALISSAATALNFSSDTFKGQLRGGSTAFITLNASSVTLQGVLLAGSNITLTTGTATTTISAAGSSPGGSSGEVQVNSDGAFGTSANITIDTTTNILTVHGTSGNIQTYYDSIVVTDTSGKVLSAGIRIFGNLSESYYLFAENLTGSVSGNKELGGIADTSGNVLARFGNVAGAAGSGALFQFTNSKVTGFEMVASSAIATSTTVPNVGTTIRISASTGSLTIRLPAIDYNNSVTHIWGDLVGDRYLRICKTDSSTNTVSFALLTSNSDVVRSVHPLTYQYECQDWQAIYNLEVDTNTPASYWEPTGRGAGKGIKLSTASVTQLLFADGTSMTTAPTGSAGSSGVGVATGSLAGYSALVSSAATVINFSSDTFQAQLRGASTAFITLNPSSVTLQGVLVAGSNITLTPGAGLTTIAATSSGGGTPQLAFGSMQKTNSQSVGGAATAQLLYQTVVSSNGLTADTTNARLVINPGQDGTYSICGETQFNLNISNSQVLTTIRKNGNDWKRLSISGSQAAWNPTLYGCIIDTGAIAGDYYENWITNSSNSMTVYGDGPSQSPINLFVSKFFGWRIR